jgi:cell division protein FtsB
MFFRRSKAKRTAQDVREQVTDLTDDLATALEAAREAIARASAAAARRGAELGAQAGRLGAELGTQAGRRGAKAGRRGARAARGAARGAAERLPEPEQLAHMSRRAADKLFPERARQRERDKRRRRNVFLAGAVTSGILGVVAGWLTAPKRGAETRQALKEQAARASEKGWERTTEPETSETAEVTPLHQGDGASTGGQSRIPPS